MFLGGEKRDIDQNLQQADAPETSGYRIQHSGPFKSHLKHDVLHIFRRRMMNLEHQRKNTVWLQRLTLNSYA